MTDRQWANTESARRDRCFQRATLAWARWTSTPLWRIRKRRRAYLWFATWEQAFYVHNARAEYHHRAASKR